MNDWWLYGGAYIALIILVAVRARLSVGHTILVALLPILWPVVLPVFLARRASRGDPPAPTSSEV